MAISVQNAHIEAYKSNVTHLAQQRSSRLRSTVMSEVMNGAIHNFERMGLTSAVVKAGRDTATPNIEVPHDRRQVTLTEYHWAARIDRGDDVRTLIDIEGKYSVNAAMAMGRQWDDIIIAAASADAVTKVPTTDPAGGDYTLGTAALPAGNIVANSVGGDTTMNLGKLLAAKEILLASDVDEDYESMYCLVTAKQLHELLNVTKITSADYNSVKALVNGEIDTFLGLKFIRTERLATRSTDKVGLVYCASAIGLAIGRDMMARVSERDDLSYASQVYTEFMAGATRLEEEKVVEILTVA
jgi:hypothetical protein